MSAGAGSVDDERTQGGDGSGAEYSVSFEDHTDTATADVTAARSPQTRLVWKLEFVCGLLEKLATDTGTANPMFSLLYTSSD